MDPLELLRNDLKDEDHEQVVATVGRLGVIAVAIGPERVRKDLLPFLVEFVQSQDNDEVNAGIATQVGEFVPYLGGPDFASLLLPFLETLCSLEETVIRNSAVASSVKVIAQLPKKEVLAKVFPLIKRLATNEWFTSRVSACGLFGVSYPMLPEDVQTELRTVFSNLCNDDTPMVRKAAFTNLGNFAGSVSKEHVKSDLIPMVKTLSEDDLDSMRIFTVDCCSSISLVLNPDEIALHVLPLVEAIHDDGSWRVRQQLCKSMEMLCRSAGDALASEKYLPMFCKLLQDSEVQVRITATRQLDKVAAVCKSGLVVHLGPVLEHIIADQNEKVRVSFSNVLIPLCPSFGPDATQKLLVPIIQTLSKDEQADVRNNVISKMEILGQVLGNDSAVDSILPTLLELSKDAKWRVRMEVVAKAGALAKQFGQDIYEKKLQPIVIAGLQDHVFSIREKACEQVCALVQAFGPEWAVATLFQPAFAIFERSTNYLHRMTALIISSHLVGHVKGPLLEKHLLPIVLAACKDDVANVRFSAAKTLGKLLPELDKSVIESHCRPVLTAMVKDEDIDVVFFADHALKTIS